MFLLYHFSIHPRCIEADFSIALIRNQQKKSGSKQITDNCTIVTTCTHDELYSIYSSRYSHIHNVEVVMTTSETKSPYIGNYIYDTMSWILTHILKVISWRTIKLLDRSQVPVYRRFFLHTVMFVSHSLYICVYCLLWHFNVILLYYVSLLSCWAYI